MYIDFLSVEAFMARNEPFILTGCYLRILLKLKNYENMNQDQRKFLIERVNKTFQAQKQKLEANKIERPSLNNYLVAAFLDNSIVP